MCPESETLLRRFALLSSPDPEAFDEVIVSRFGATRASSRKSADFRGRASLLQLQGIRLAFVGVNTESAVEFPEGTEFRQRFILSGKTETIIDGCHAHHGPNDSIIILPGQSNIYNFKENFSQLVLALEPAVVERKLMALLGCQRVGRLEFNEGDHSPHLRALSMFLARQFDQEVLPFPPLLQQHLEEALVVAFLSNERSFSRQLNENSALPSTAVVRRAEEYLEANWDRAVSIEELVGASGVSGRTLFRAFRKARGYSPSQFAKLARLRRAKAMLETVSPGTTVTSISLKLGFLNLGHFARDFRNAFGESPSVTLARGLREKLNK